MAIIYSYSIATPQDTDLLIISRTPTDPDEISNYSVSMSSVADYVIDRFINPDATDFKIPVFNQSGTRITGSIMSQDSSPSNGVAGTKITIAGNTTTTGDVQIDTLTSGYIPFVSPLAGGVLRDSGFYQIDAPVTANSAIGLNTTKLATTYGEYPDLRVAHRGIFGNVPGVLDLFRKDGDVLAGDKVGVLQYSIDDDSQYTVAQIEVRTIGNSGGGNTGGGKLCIKTSSNQAGAQPTERLCIDNTEADFSVPINVTDLNRSSFAGQVTIPATPVAATDAASKAYVDLQNTGQVSGTGTTNTLPVWSDGPNSVLSDSAIRQQSSGVGVIISGLIEQSSTFKSIYIGDNVGLQTTGLNAYNVGIGELALESFTQGLDSGGVFVEAENVAIGYQSLQSLESGTNNVAIGAGTLLDNVAGANNIAIGKNSLASLTGTRAQSINNIALGFNTLGSLLNGANNVAIGHTAFEAATSVEDSIMLGKWVGKGITPASVQSSVIIGENACVNSNATNLDYSVIIGFQAGQATQGNVTSDIFIGNNAGRQIQSTGYNIAIGNVANQSKAVKSSISIGSSEVVSSNFADSYAVAIGSYDQGDVGIGSQISASGKYSVVIGGIGNLANAKQSVVLAGKSNTIDAAAENAAIIGGFNNSISSVGSAGMALGSNLEVEGANQVVLGRYNAGNNNSKLIVGAGFSNANRINAFEVKNTSQLRLGKYGQTPPNFPATSSAFTNVLVVGAANNVTEIPLSNAAFNSQLLPPGTRSVTAGSITNLSSQEEKIVKISWTGTTGNAILRLPLASNFVNKTIRFITDSSFPATATAQITGNGGTETINGLTAGVTLTGTYQATMVWSDAAEWWVL